MPISTIRHYLLDNN